MLGEWNLPTKTTTEVACVEQTNLYSAYKHKRLLKECPANLLLAHNPWSILPGLEHPYPLMLNMLY